MRGPYFLLGPSLLAGSWPGLYHPRAARSHPVPLALAAGVPLRRLALLIGIDDRRHQRMTHHVALVEPHHAYARDTLQGIERMAQPAAGAGRQIDLAEIARHHHAGALAHAGEEHLHLHRRGVLRLVENDEGMRERAAAHEGER